MPDNDNLTFLYCVQLSHSFLIIHYYDDSLAKRGKIDNIKYDTVYVMYYSMKDSDNLYRICCVFFSLILKTNHEKSTTGSSAALVLCIWVFPIDPIFRHNGMYS